MTFLASAAWAAAGAIIGISWLYVMCAGIHPPPVSEVWRAALRSALVFGAWRALTAALTAVSLMGLARWRNHFRLVSFRRMVAYAGIGQAVLLFAARFMAMRLPWHSAAVALHEMPLPLVAAAGAAIVGTGLLMLRRTERVVASP